MDLQSHRGNLQPSPTMKRHSNLLVLATLSLTGFCSPVQAGGSAVKNPPMVQPAPEPGYDLHSTIKGGFFWLQDESISAVGLHADINFDDGWGITVVPIGFNVCEGFSLSLSAGIYQADIESISLHGRGLNGTYGVDGDVTMVPLMANGVARIPLFGPLSWYLGGGIGAVYSNVDVNGVAGARVDASSDGWDFGFQAFSGLSVRTCPRSDIHVGYRYLHVFGDDDDHQGHALEAGFSIKF